MCRVFVGYVSGFVGICQVIPGIGCRVQILVIYARIRENVYAFVRWPVIDTEY
jgi:hypothetical protein